jgi:hypothetical protein
VCACAGEEVSRQARERNERASVRADITGQREPGERVIAPRKHHSMDKEKDRDEDKENGTTSASIELNERSRPISESGARNEMLARQIFSKHSPLDPPRHEKRHSRQASKCT